MVVEEYKKVDVLVEAGLKKNEAKALFYLLTHGKSVSRDIEQEMNMRQPEVCNALLFLSGKGWLVKKAKKPKGGKGRPEIILAMAVPKKRIFDELKRSLMGRQNNIRQAIAHLISLEESIQ